MAELKTHSCDPAEIAALLWDMKSQTTQSTLPATITTEDHQTNAYSVFNHAIISHHFLPLSSHLKFREDLKLYHLADLLVFLCWSRCCAWYSVMLINFVLLCFLYPLQNMHKCTHAISNSWLFIQCNFLHQFTRWI